jgi:hypothetical protein
VVVNDENLCGRKNLRSRPGLRRQFVAGESVRSVVAIVIA